jgi:hypothetical protein
VMEAINLTDEHKFKLLEMCKELFPEYKDLNYWKSYICDGWGHGIHWFEFCMTHLVNKLAWCNIKTDILADCEYESIRLKYLLELAKDRPSPGQYHPVDYLYEEFKKLKQC